jgi:hypothetical protein
MYWITQHCDYDVHELNKIKIIIIIWKLNKQIQLPLFDRNNTIVLLRDVFHIGLVIGRDVFHIGLVIGPRSAVLAFGCASGQYSRPRDR